MQPQGRVLPSQADGETRPQKAITYGRYRRVHRRVYRRAYRSAYYYGAPSYYYGARSYAPSYYYGGYYGRRFWY
jgi:hypothetical protein